MFKEYEVVALKRDLPAKNLKTGDTGTILMIYPASPSAYEVEFSDDEGITLALLTLEDEDLIALSADDLIQREAA